MRGCYTLIEERKRGAGLVSPQPYFTGCNVAFHDRRGHTLIGEGGWGGGGVTNTFILKRAAMFFQKEKESGDTSTFKAERLKAERLPVVTEGRLEGVACLGSGYDFKAEMALGEDSHGMSYDLIILHYWKDYVHRHRRVLAKGGIDLAAVKRARSLPVRPPSTGPREKPRASEKQDKMCRLCEQHSRNCAWGLRFLEWDGCYLVFV